MPYRVSLFTVAVLSLTVLPASAAEWGTLKGRIVFDGTAPAPAVITPDKDVEVCSVHKLFDESLQVSDDGGLANVVIFVRTKGISIHPDYEKQVGEEVVLDNANCRFEPHVVGLWIKNTLVLKNSDSVPHNAKIEMFSNSSRNSIIPSKGRVEERFDQDETVPVTVSCNIHPWMKSVLLVRTNPYFAVTDKDGNFEIRNLPASKELEFQFWHEKSGYLKGAKFASVKADARGRLKTKLQAGVNGLGDAKVPANLFNKE